MKPVFVFAGLASAIMSSWGTDMSVYMLVAKSISPCKEDSGTTWLICPALAFPSTDTKAVFEARGIILLGCLWAPPTMLDPASLVQEKAVSRTRTGYVSKYILRVRSR